VPRAFPIKTCGTKSPPRAGCSCFRCEYARSYRRQWRKDQFKNRTKSRDKIILMVRRGYRRHHEKRTAYARGYYWANHLQQLIYHQLLRILKSEETGSSSPDAGSGQGDGLECALGGAACCPSTGRPELKGVA
jgi:hypothetical protein